MSEATEKTDEAENELGYEDWAEELRDGRLVGVECNDCGHLSGVPRAVCTDCGGRQLDEIELGTEGEVVSETSINVPPVDFDRGYQVVIAEVDGVRVTGRVEDGKVDIGEVVEFDDVHESSDHGKERPSPVFSPK
ncbi:MAG: Zn-ribbon domain-containing OB-fold protein [Halobacteria archaeon]